MEIDKETLAYLRQNIENEIKQNLESRLFKLYAIIGAAFLGGVGIVGFPWAVSYIDDKIQSLVQERVDATKQTIDELQDKTEMAGRDLDRALERIAVKRESIDEALAEIQTQSSRVTQQLNTLRGETQQQSDQMRQRSDELAGQLANMERMLDDARDQAEVLSNQLRTRGPDAGVVQSLASTMDIVLKQVEELDLAVKTISQQGDSRPPTVADENRAAQISNLQRIAGQNVEQIQRSARTPTVYFQFAVLTRDNAKAISGQLKARGWNIPGEERIESATGRSEIRCYYQADCDQAAPKLKTDIEATLNQLGYSNASIDIKPLLSYSPKPRQGILEIWFGLDKPAAS
jgi:archaellum component FlaC